MNKIYNIVHSSQTLQSNNINVNIDSLDTIFDCSADGVFCSCLEFVANESLAPTITKILSKLKPSSGFVTFSIRNIKHLCASFVKGVVSGDDLLKQVQNIKSVVVIENLYTNIDTDRYKVAQLFQNDETISLTVERQKI